MSVDDPILRDRGGEGLPVMDPRMWERRAEVQRATSRHRLRLVGARLGVLTLAASALGVAHSSLLGVRHVRLGGDGGPEVRVLAEAGIRMGEPLIDVSPGGAEARLDAVPDVAAATVSRSWPGTLDITVTLRRPVAQVPLGGSTNGPVALVDATGRVLSRLPAPQPGLPDLGGVGTPGRPGSWLWGAPGAGADGRPGAPIGDELAQPGTATTAALAFLVQVERTEAAVGPGRRAGRLTRVVVAPGGDLTGVARPGSVALALGDGTALAQKASALVAFLRAVPLTGLAAVDFTVPNRPTATMVGSSVAPGN